MHESCWAVCTVNFVLLTLRPLAQASVASRPIILPSLVCSSDEDNEKPLRLLPFLISTLVPMCAQGQTLGQKAFPTPFSNQTVNPERAAAFPLRSRFAAFSPKALNCPWAFCHSHLAAVLSRRRTAEKTVDYSRNMSSLWRPTGWLLEHTPRHIFIKSKPV